MTVMEEVIMGRKDLVVMKLLHYFITERNYTPIILQGAQDEIWLENNEVISLLLSLFFPLLLLP